VANLDGSLRSAADRACRFQHKISAKTQPETTAQVPMAAKTIPADEMMGCESAGDEFYLGSGDQAPRSRTVAVRVRARDGEQEH
jgi:hypothetical protein